MGLSDRQPGRRLTDWPNDVLRLSESLQLDSFSVAGISGGGPHALACAAALADRVDVAVVISGAAPLDTTDATVGMRRMNRTVVTLARRAPWVLRLMMAPNMFAARRFPDVYERVATKGLPEPDRVALRETALKEALLADNREAARRGARGVVEDLVIFTGSWGFDLSEIKMPVHLWHGDLDANAPIAMGERMASEISESVLHRCPGEGHMLAAKHWSEIEGVLKAGA
jgi:pimeloyl-ACP methyl ester carboxylesterase